MPLRPKLERKRQKWFRNMRSSQALALSFFGNLVVYGKLEWLRDLESDDRLPDRIDPVETDPF